MINTLLFVHLIIALLLIIVILLQKTSNDGLSGIGGGNMGLVSGRSAANFLTRTTVVLAIVFFCNALVLANLSSRSHSNLTKKIENFDNSTDVPAKEESLPMAK